MHPARSIADFRWSSSENDIPEPRPWENRSRRIIPESDTSSEFGSPAIGGSLSSRNAHLRSLSEADPSPESSGSVVDGAASEAERPAPSRRNETWPSAVYEDQTATIEEENTRWRPVEDHLPPFAVREENFAASPGNRPTTPLSYRTGTVRQQSMDYDDS